MVSYSYDIPVPKNDFFQNQFFKGWSISGIVTYQSGLPFSILDSTSGGGFGATGLATGLLVCRPLIEQVSNMPGCTPGTTTMIQILTSGWPLKRANSPTRSRRLGIENQLVAQTK